MDKILQLSNNIASIFNYKLPSTDKRMVKLSKILKQLVEEKFTPTNKQSAPLCTNCEKPIVHGYCHSCAMDMLPEGD